MTEPQLSATVKLSSASNSYFAEESQGDLVIYPSSSNQRILLGNVASEPAVLQLDKATANVSGTMNAANMSTNLIQTSGIHLSTYDPLAGNTLELIAPMYVPAQLDAEVRSMATAASNQAYGIGELSQDAVTLNRHLLPNGDETIDLGASNMRFRSLYISGNTIYMGPNKIGSDSTGAFSITSADPAAQPVRLVIDELQIGQQASSNTTIMRTDNSTGQLKFVRAVVAEVDGQIVQQEQPNSTVQVGAFVTASNGWVSLGRSNAAAPLDIDGDVILRSNVSVQGSLAAGSIVSLSNTAGGALLTIESSPGALVTGSDAGDVVLRNDDPFRSLHLQVGTGAGVPTMTLSAGNVGIGTTTPSATLHVAGRAHFDSNVTMSNLTVHGDLTAVRTIYAQSNVVIYQSEQVNSNLTVLNNISGCNITACNVIAGSVAASNLGVGTSAPSARLHVAGTAKFDGDAVASNVHVYGDLTTSRAIITASNISAFSSNPDIELRTLDNTGSQDAGGISWRNSGGNYVFRIGRKLNASNTSYPRLVVTGGNGQVGSLQTALAVDSFSANVGVGTVDPLAKLHVAGTSKFDGDMVTSNIRVHGTVQSSDVTACNLTGTTLNVIGQSRIGSNISLSNATGIATVAASGTSLAFGGLLSGDGAGLSNLSAGNVSSGSLEVARGGTGVTTSTGTGSVVLNFGPTLSNVSIGGAGSINVAGPVVLGSNVSLSNATGVATVAASGTSLAFGGLLSGDGAGLSNLSADSVSSGILPLSRGGLGIGTATGVTGAGNVVLSSNATLTGTTTMMGSVGIGSSVAPAAQLDVRVPSTQQMAVTALCSNMGNNTFNHFAMGMATSSSNCAVIKYTHVGSNNAGNLAEFGVWGFNNITCRADGNVGVGTQAPGARLHVAGTSKFDGDVATSNLTVHGDLTASKVIYAYSNVVVYNSTVMSSNISACNITASNLTGTVLNIAGQSRVGSNVQLSNATGVATIAASGTGLSFGGLLSGDGAGLSNLNAGSVSSGTLAVARGGTGTTMSTGTGSVVLSANPTITGAAISGATITSSTVGVANITGTLPIANGGTGAAVATGTGGAVLSNAPTLLNPTFLGVTTCSSTDAVIRGGLGSLNFASEWMVCYVADADGNNNGADHVFGWGGGGNSVYMNTVQNGTFNERMRLSSVGNLTITGTYAGNGANIGSLNATNITTGTLAVARGGTGVTTSTGTGSVVLSANPTISGNVNYAAPGTGTVSSTFQLGSPIATETGAQHRVMTNQNGILACYQNDQISFVGNGFLRTKAGSSSNFVIDINTTSSFCAINAWTGNMTNSRTLFLNSNVSSANDNGWVVVPGRLGVGTSSPATPLHVVGSTRVDGNLMSFTGNAFSAVTASNSLCTVDLAAVFNPNEFATGSVAGDAVVRNSLSTRRILMSVGSAAATMALSSSNVGIGTLTPTTALHVVGDMQASNAAGPVAVTAFSSSNFIQMGTAFIATQYSSSSTVGDGVIRTQDGRRLHLLSGSGSATVTISGSNPTVTPVVAIVNSNVGIGTGAPVTPLHVTGTSRFDSNVSVGTGSNYGRLHVHNGNITVSALTTAASNAGSHGGIYFKSLGRASNIVSAAVASGTVGWDDAGFITFNTNPGGTTLFERMRITDSGLVGIGKSNPAFPLDVYTASVNAVGIACDGDIQSLSDRRVKHDVVRIEDAASKVAQLNGYTYVKHVTDAATGQVVPTRRLAGVIAQEVHTVLPEVVTETPDGMLTVSYGNMVALLIEAIKEVAGKVDRMEARMTGVV
jgi:hypothetical protein